MNLIKKPWLRNPMVLGPVFRTYIKNRDKDPRFQAPRLEGQGMIFLVFRLLIGGREAGGLLRLESRARQLKVLQFRPKSYDLKVYGWLSRLL